MAELQATVRFRRLAVELRAVQAAPEVVSLAEEAVEDEQRHALICQRLAKSYGAMDELPFGEIEAPPLGQPDMKQRDRLLYEIVAFCCVTETINSAMLVEILRCATDVKIRAAVRDILRDEVNHSRLGWAHLSWEHRQGRSAWLASSLVHIFERIGLHEIMQVTGTRESQRLSELGELNDQQRVDILQSTLRDVILPGFATFGVATQDLRTWLASQGVFPGP